jgi:hypothetical protein
MVNIRGGNFKKKIILLGFQRVLKISQIKKQSIQYGTIGTEVLRVYDTILSTLLQEKCSNVYRRHIRLFFSQLCPSSFMCKIDIFVQHAVMHAASCYVIFIPVPVRC